MVFFQTRKSTTNGQQHAALQMRNYLGAALLFLLGLSMSLLAQAQEDFSPMLTLVAGEQRLELSAEDLAKLPQHSYKTSTAWTTGVPQVQGPLMRDVLALVGVTQNKVQAVRLQAWDAYAIDLTSEDYFLWDVILATHINGEALTLETNGPIWVVYPRDQYKVLQDSRYHHRWVWMLSEIHVSP